MLGVLKTEINVAGVGGCGEGDGTISGLYTGAVLVGFGACRGLEGLLKLKSGAGGPLCCSEGISSAVSGASEWAVESRSPRKLVASQVPKREFKDSLPIARDSLPGLLDIC